MIDRQHCEVTQLECVYPDILIYEVSLDYSFPILYDSSLVHMTYTCCTHITDELLLTLPIITLLLLFTIDPCYTTTCIK